MMTPSELLSELSVRIYSPPLSAIRDSGAIADVSNPLCVLILVIDFDTEVAMNGIADFLGNSTGRYAVQTVSALREIGCPKEAALLEQVLSVAGRAGMSHDAIQAERTRLQPYTITSFRQLHGDKWDEVLVEIGRLCDRIDFDHVGARAEAFAAEHQNVLEERLRQGRPTMG